MPLMRLDGSPLATVNWRGCGVSGNPAHAGIPAANASIHSTIIVQRRIGRPLARSPRGIGILATHRCMRKPSGRSLHRHDVRAPAPLLLESTQPRHRYEPMRRIAFPLLGLFFCAAWSGANAADPESWQLDPVHTRVLFAVEHAGFSKAMGTVSGSTGTLLFDRGDWSSARLDVRVP